MEEIVTSIQKLFEAEVGIPVSSIEKIPQSGSDRIYFRIFTSGNSYVATHGRNIKENETFIYFSRHFRACGSPVPDIHAVNPDKTIYIQEDLGNVSLLNKLDELGYSNEVYALFQSSLRHLAHLQIKGDQGLDYNRCIPSHEFGRQ